MNLNSRDDQSFLNRLTAIVEANLSNEQFGVNELAEKTGLSRSQIHRRLKKSCNKSVSQFIREVRLEKAKELLGEESLTVSEIAYKVGFGSPSYFIKSFHDYFGYPPGEFSKYVHQYFEKEENKLSEKLEVSKPRKSLKWFFLLMVFLSTVVIVYLVIQSGEIKKAINSNEKLIIVLPLDNLTPEENNQHFAVGISEDIRRQLIKIPGLKVKSGISSKQLRENTLISSEIAKLAADAHFILDGSIRQENNDVRIHIELVDGLQNTTIWSENYDRSLEDIFAIQNDIAKNVADTLQLILSPQEIKQIEKLHPKNIEAYNYYLMGRYLWDRRDSVSLQKSVEFFNKAIDIDSDYALAYAGLADAIYAQSFRGFIERDTGYQKAFDIATNALQMNDSLPEAYAVLGIVNYFGYWNWEDARVLLKMALAIDSNCMEAHLYYCSFLDIVGESDNALKHANKAIELQPTYHMPYVMKGIIYRNVKKYKESLDEDIKSLVLDPKSWESSAHTFLNFFSLNDDSSAVRTFQELFTVHPEYLEYINLDQSAYESSGKNGMIRLFLDINLQRKKQNLCLLAGLYNLLGMQNEALTYLERACREREGDVPRIIRKPEFESLHTNPRFQALVDTMNLRPYFKKASK